MEDILFDCPLEIDEAALEERDGSAILADEKIKVFSGENRLGLQRGDTKRRLINWRSKALFDLPFRCIAHAHPECRFRWVRLVMNFSSVTDAVIQDMSPKKVVGQEPIKIVTNYRGGLSFEVEKFKLGPEVNLERTTEQQIYFPIINSTGVNFAIAHWTFKCVGEQDLYVNRDLRLLLKTPPDIKQLNASFTLRADVQAKGIVGLIPLVGRKKATIEIFETIED